MKREFWEHDGGPIAIDSIVTSTAMGRIVFKKVVVHESRWIPVSERMPTKTGHYHVFRLDREDWCLFLIETLETPPHTQRKYFTSKGVTHWLEAPPLPTPLPVETEPSDFEKWYAHHGDWYEKKLLAEKAWNAAKESQYSPPLWRTSKDGIHCDYCGCFTDSHSDTCKARATSSPASESPQT